MNYRIENTMLRQLNANELFSFSGGTKVCSYEVANRRYVWRGQTAWEWFVEQVNKYRP